MSCRAVAMGAFPDFDWNLLKTFQAIARHGSVSAAARALHREQPSVSAALKRLEDHFGTALCDRSSRGVVLTPAGQATLEAAIGIARIVEDLSDTVADSSERTRTTLTLRMISDVVAPSLDRAMMIFHRAFPAVELKIDIAPWREVIEAVERSEATLGVACDSAPSPRLSYRPLVHEAQQLYCGPDHPLFGSAPCDPGAFGNEAFVLTGNDEPDELRRFRFAHNLGRRSCGTADTLHEARKLIQMGFGVGFLPTGVGEAAEAPLWPLLPLEILPQYPLYIVTKRDAELAPRTHRLVEVFLAGLMADGP